MIRIEIDGHFLKSWHEVDDEGKSIDVTIQLTSKELLDKIIGDLELRVLINNYIEG